MGKAQGPWLVGAQPPQVHSFQFPERGLVGGSYQVLEVGVSAVLPFHSLELVK